jgi:hypothetical protein
MLYFMVTWYILWSFGIVFPVLVCLATLDSPKSLLFNKNPATDKETLHNSIAMFSQKDKNLGGIRVYTYVHK